MTRSTAVIVVFVLAFALAVAAFLIFDESGNSEGGTVSGTPTPASRLAPAGGSYPAFA